MTGEASGAGGGPDLEISRAWLVDPASGREGPGEIVVEDGVLEAVTWLEGDEAGAGQDVHDAVDDKRREFAAAGLSAGVAAAADLERPRRPQA